MPTIIPATREAEAGGSQIQGQSEQFGETLPQNKRASEVVQGRVLA